MPLFKKHHDAPVDSTNYQSTGVNDPNYVGGPTSTGYPSDANTYAGAPPASHASGVGAPIDSSYGTQSGVHRGHPGAATAGGTAVGAAAGHELGGHTGPGAMAGGIAGNHASRQHNQPSTGYGDAGYGDTGYDDTGYGNTGYGGTGYADQPGTFNSTTTSHHPVRNEVGGAALGAEAGHHMGGHGGTGAAAGGFAGREHAHHTGGNVHNTAATGGTTGGMSMKDAKSLEMKGKAQQLAGMVLSSQSMKAKGQAKEQEAAAIRHHQTNVAEAEAHEAQARLARERAGQGPYH